MLYVQISLFSIIGRNKIKLSQTFIYLTHSKYILGSVRKVDVYKPMFLRN